MISNDIRLCVEGTPDVFVNFNDLFRPRDRIRDLTEAETSAERFAVMGGAKLGVDLVRGGLTDPSYKGLPPVLYEDKARAFERAHAIAQVSLHDSVLGCSSDPDNPLDWSAVTFTASDYDAFRDDSNTMNIHSQPRKGIYSLGIIAAVRADVGLETLQEAESLPLSALTPLSLHGISRLVEVTFKFTKTP